MQEKDREKRPERGASQPHLNESGRAAVADKLQRQAAALRANLKRRKEQQRERSAKDES